MKAHKRRKKTSRSAGPVESSASEAITVAWTVTLTTLILCNLSILALHLYLRSDPRQEGLQLLKELLLFGGAVVGAMSLVLLPAVVRVRRVPPPRGVVVFGACLALAPILALFARGIN